MALVINGSPVAKSASTLNEGESASMSLIYKGHIEEDSELAVMIFTAAEMNDIEPLNMQLSYKLFGFGVEVNNELPACSTGLSELDD